MPPPNVYAPPPAAPPPVLEQPPAPLEPPKPPKKRRRIGWIIAVVLLSLALIAALAVIVLSLQRLDEARHEIEKQQQLIDEKQTFTAAMTELMSTAGEFDGVLFHTIVPQGDIDRLAARGYDHRWDASAVARDTVAVRDARADLAELRTAAQEQAATNTSGTTYESVIDSLGSGFVASVLDDADTLCESDVLGCVVSDDPYTVHFDAADVSLPWMTDYIQTGLAYHEFAHVLQMTNPDPTRTAVEAFGGDVETMADCYALTYLDGWTLDHTVWTSGTEYWEVSVGYGYVCDATQRQAVIDWYEALGYHSTPAAQ